VSPLHNRRWRFAVAGLAAAASVLIACGAADTDDDPVGLSDRDLPTTARELPSSPVPAPTGSEGQDDQGGSDGGGKGTGQQAAAGDCEAYANSASWCTDGIGDYDCEGGSGDGPNYAPRGVQVVEPGVDPFGLDWYRDADSDGVVCE
jgi:hypothetical protein